YKGKEIAKPITPPSETASEEDGDPEQAQRDKAMQKNLALIEKYFKKIYKPTNNNLRTSLNSRNNNVDTTPRPVVQQFGIQCFNCKEFGHFAKECRKPKRVKDSAYHKEKMLLCKQAKQGVPLQAEQYDWLADTDEEIDEQELEAHYSNIEKIQEVPTANIGTDSEPLEQVQNDAVYNVFANDLQHSEQSESVSNTYLVETDDSNVIPDSPNMCDDGIQNEQNDVERDDERVVLTNLKLDVDENKKIQKQLKKANTTLAQELKECKTIRTEFEKYKAFNDRTIDYDKLERKLNETLRQLAQKDIEIKEGLKTKAYEISVVKEKHDELIKQSLLTKSHYEGLDKQKTKVITDLKPKEEHDIDKMLSMEKQLKFLNEIVYKRSQSIQTIHMMAPKVRTYNGRPTFANPRYLKQAQSEIPYLYAFLYDQSTYANRLIPNGEETLALERETRSKLNKDLVEGRLVEFKKQEIKFCEKIRVLEFKVESKTDRIEYLTNELEMLKKEKGDLDSKLIGFQTTSKDLDNLLESQRSDKNKEGLGYNVVSPPPAQVYSPPKKDLSWTGLPKFADDTVTDYSRPSPAIESSSDDLQNKNHYVTETGASSSTILSKPAINFVKAAERPTESKTDKVEMAKKHVVKYAELYRKTTKRTMATTIEQQVEMDEALVPSTQRLRIRRSNFRLPSDIESKESTLQLVYDVLRRCPFFKAFLVTTDVPEIYMQEFWTTANVHQHSIRFKMDNKKHILDLESFRNMLHICPSVQGQTFTKLPFEEEILDFIRFLGHSATIRTLTDVNINKLYQPWRSFAAIINKCLTRKSSSYDSFRLSQA
nr:hypothetical protein [Tanacetum cinerariifolium]